MDLTQSEVKKVSDRRKHISRMREIKCEIKRVEKLMNTVSSLQTALQLTVREIPNVQKVMLVLGGSPIRPRYVYELFFSHGEVVSSGSGDFSKSKAAEMLSRKVSYYCYCFNLICFSFSFSTRVALGTYIISCFF